MQSLFRGFRASRRQYEETSATPSLRCSALVVGLGNPGSEHARNRHNVGFWCLNELARRAGAGFERRGRVASIAEGLLSEQRVVLAKPRTFVNDSGGAVADLLRRYRLEAAELIVVCDDLDLSVGALRLRARGGNGGHNGLRSIIGAIGSEDFSRVRIGIGRPKVNGQPTWDPEHIARYVLGDPPSGERQILESTVHLAADAVQALLSEGIERAMARFNSRPDSTAPPR